MTDQDRLVIAVVEDNEDVLHHTVASLRSFGHDVRPVSAPISEVLLDDHWWEHIDIALVDLHLPHFSGRELLRWLMTHVPHVIRIAFSADEYVTLADAREAREAHGYMPKPFRHNDLMRVLNEAQHAAGRG